MHHSSNKTVPFKLKYTKNNPNQSRNRYLRCNIASVMFAGAELKKLYQYFVHAFAYKLLQLQKQAKPDQVDSKPVPL